MGEERYIAWWRMDADTWTRVALGSDPTALAVQAMRDGLREGVLETCVTVDGEQPWDIPCILPTYERPATAQWLYHGDGQWRQVENDEQVNLDAQGRRHVEKKEQTKGKIGRSPDDADSFNLSHHEVPSNAVMAVEPVERPRQEQGGHFSHRLRDRR